MIDLTPLEVRQKKGDFRRGFRGYDVELVNDFLDLTADRMEELARENMALSERVETLESEVREFREKERSLSEALMTAQRLREDARSLAEKEGELLIREARSAAEAAREEAVRLLAREDQALRHVRARRSELVGSFRRLLERELSELAVIEETLELSAEPEEEPAQSGPGEGRSAGEPAAASRPATPPGEESSTEPKKPAGSGEAGPPARKAGKGGAKTEPQSAPSADTADRGQDQGEAADEEDDWLSSLMEESQRDGT